MRDTTMFFEGSEVPWLDCAYQRGAWEDARGWFVYNTLTQHAARTQAALRAALEARGVSYQSFWAANMIVATADRALLESLAAREDVARIDSNNAVRWIEPPELADFSVAPSSPSAPNTAE